MLYVNKIVGVFTIFKDDVRQPDFLHFHVVFGTVVFFSSCSARRQTSKSSTFPPHIKEGDLRATAGGVRGLRAGVGMGSLRKVEHFMHLPSVQDLAPSACVVLFVNRPSLVGCASSPSARRSDLVFSSFSDPTCTFLLKICNYILL